jgi:adenine-specific DNA-methyltransferase
MSHSKERLEQVRVALRQAASGPLREGTRGLLNLLGYDSPKTLETSGDPLELLSALGADPAAFDDFGGVGAWSSLDVVFQLTGDELPALARGSTPTTADDYRKRDIDSFVFLALDLQARDWPRRDLVGITRALNRLFDMPAIVLFRQTGHATLAVIDRRRNLRDATRDVVGGRISLIKDIDLAAPHRAHLDILADLSLSGLRPAPTDFRSLYDAWLKVLSASELNKRFYRDLADWFAWASAGTEDMGHVVRFPPGQGNDQNDRSVGLIRLLTRLMFVWFIKQKNLVPDDLFDRESLSGLLAEAPDKYPEGNGYYLAILQNLFFACLNTDQSERGWLDRKAADSSKDYFDHSRFRHRDLFADATAAEAAFKSVPFLNGGLFDCLDVEIDSGDHRADRAGREVRKRNGRDYVALRVDGFSETARNQPNLPNKLFFGGEADADLSQFYQKQTHRRVHGLIDLFDSYKFTVEENTPLEEEAALDPELLGKVFENLLASYNEDTGTTARNKSGSFYTPREVVDFMVDEALVAYLAPALAPSPSERLRPRAPGLDFGPAAGELSLELPQNLATAEVNVEVEGRLRDLLSYAVATPTFTDAEKDALVAAIEQCRSIDPAVGSGAFPLGLLQKLVHVLSRLDPTGAKWKARNREPLERDLENARTTPSPSDRAERVAVAEARLAAFDESFDTGAADYARKLYLIEGCLHGVDIQPIAVQIAKLRCFIALAVEQTVDDAKPNRGVTPLPNLEMKFVAANALGFVQSKNAGLRDSGITALETERSAVSATFFSARDRQSKRKARERIQAIREELGVLLASTGLPADDARTMAEWNPFDANAAAPFFDPEWMFGLKTKTETEGCFDIVLANPPYVRQEKIESYCIDGKPANAKSKLREHYATFGGTADLYVYFYERSVRLLKPGGVIAFITSNKWFRVGYGAKLRAWLSSETRLRTVIDFGDAEVFEAIAYPTIVVAERRAVRHAPLPNESFRALNWVPGQPSEGFPVRFANEAFAMPQAALSSTGWQLEPQAKRDLLTRIRAGRKPLGEWCGGRFYRGPVTGYNKAFILDDNEKAKLSSYLDEPEKLLKPFIRGRDVKRWQVASANLWLLFIPWHFPLHDQGIQGSSSEAEHDFQRLYPEVYQHLAEHKSELMKRSPSETGRLYEWYALQRWAADFWHEFEKPKVFIAAISDKPTAAVDRSGLWPNNKASVFITDSPEFVSAIFNSTVSNWYARQVYASKQGDFFDFEPRYSSSLPIPSATTDQMRALVTLVNAIIAGAKPRAALEGLINAFVYELFFAEDLSALDISPFDTARDAGLLALAEHKGPALARASEEWATCLADPSHPLYAMLFSLQSVEAVRVIEGRA